MNEIKKSLRDSAKARWIALVTVSIAMFGAYYFNYAMSPVKPMLESMLGWNSTDFGVYTSSYGWFNVFLFMLVFSGIILDKFGIRFTGLAATIVMALGTGINYWALIHVFPEGSSIFGIKTQVMISAIGFGVFGVGTEAAGITVSKAVVKWFKGYEMALAMGMQMSIARLGTALALGISLPVAKAFNYASPVLFAFVFMLIGITAFIIYTFMDKKLDASIITTEVEGQKEDDFEIKDILLIIKNKAFWYIAVLCVLFYSAVFPFLYYATDLMINKYHVDPNLAGTIPALLPFGTIFLTPLFGSIYDKKGKGATIMMIGSVILIFVHSMLTIPGLTSWLLATVMVIILGIGFSLVPAAMWPSVPKIIPEKQLGTAYAVIFWIQNIGLLLIPLVLGMVLTLTNPAVAPNKQMLKDSFVKAYTQVLTKKDTKLTEEKIKSFAEKASSQLVDHVIQTSQYESASKAHVNTDEISKEITQNLVNALNSYQFSSEKENYEKELNEAMVKSVSPIIIKAKLNIRYDYFFDLLLFTMLSILALLFAYLLKKEDKKKGYGLELPNIKQA